MPNPPPAAAPPSSAPRSGGVEIEVRSLPEGHIALCGAAVGSTARELQARLLELPAMRGDVEVNLSELSDLDCVGAQVLLAFGATCTPRRVRCVHCPTNITRKLERLGLDRDLLG